MSRRETRARSGYSRAFRGAEILGIGIVAVLVPLLTTDLVPHLPERWATFSLGMLVGVLFMDFASGIFHWACDTWGSVHWRWIGPTVLRTFREHHRDPAAITRHDIIEVNGTNCLLAIPILSSALWWSQDFFFQSCALAVAVLGAATNQIHLWAHRPNNPWWIRQLQRSGLILSPQRHAPHHLHPHTDHYCITTGWLNWLLAKLHFFRALEWIIYRVTGASPRAESQP